MGERSGSSGPSACAHVYGYIFLYVYVCLRYFRHTYLHAYVCVRIKSRYLYKCLHVCARARYLLCAAHGFPSVAAAVYIMDESHAGDYVPKTAGGYVVVQPVLLLAKQSVDCRQPVIFVEIVQGPCS